MKLELRTAFYDLHVRMKDEARANYILIILVNSPMRLVRCSMSGSQERYNTIKHKKTIQYNINLNFSQFIFCE